MTIAIITDAAGQPRFTREAFVAPAGDGHTHLVKVGPRGAPTKLTWCGRVASTPIEQPLENVTCEYCRKIPADLVWPHGTRA